MFSPVGESRPALWPASASKFVGVIFETGNQSVEILRASEQVGKHINSVAVVFFAKALKVSAAVFKSIGVVIVHFFFS